MEENGHLRISVDGFIKLLQGPERGESATSPGLVERFSIIFTYYNIASD